ncbi:hypothetical protein MesoLjLc_17030 [Mesorhizobium sp. L-8-10]|uniref:TetR/AcrR family transcriptional regulator n=1 Tax=Mesorhizobium sp. L-8-10 TaxID=2744523 RepID=UPI001928D075|nr:TetR family transcriptional regulator [Mesorhizobium sp. L-8-10]BCH29773.1 hypothetical protein MesoLjLc_17030 [Mesorhizobium sp. L-8-10]
MRTIVTRSKIAEGAIHVLAHAGVAGLTHREVARAADVSLAATTYHFDTKADIIEEASRTLLDGYLHAFRRLATRVAEGSETGVTGLADLVERIVLNALGRERIRSLAWSELILHGGRTTGGRRLAQIWYEQLDAIWYDIARLVEPAAPKHRAGAAVDLTIGLTFILHPLGLDPAVARELLAGRLDPEGLLRDIAIPAGVRHADTDGAPSDPSARYAQTRQRILEAAIEIIVREGAVALSHRRVAEVAGMVRSGPSYYFATIEELLATAQNELFERAKARYRSGLDAAGAAELDESRLLDLTTAIFFREALEFGSENIGYYSVWMSAAQSPSLRPAVATSLFDLHRAWSRRITSALGRSPGAGVPLHMQAIFIGKLVRAITAAVGVPDLARARADFADVLAGSLPAP